MNSEKLLNLTYFRGRVALYAILKALGIRSGDEVATQAFTCLAVPEGIMATGAKPLYVDIESQGYNLDPNDLQVKLTPQTKAIVVQHTFGIPAQMKPIMQIATQAGIPVIEDCCHTLLSSYENQQVGTFGVASFYSFEWGKPLVAGLGGSAIIQDSQLEQKVLQGYQSFINPQLKTRVKLNIQYAIYRMLYRPQYFWVLRNLFQRLSKVGAVAGNYNPLTEMDQKSPDFGWLMAPRLKKRLIKKLIQIQEQTEHSSRLTKQYRQHIDSTTLMHPQIAQQNQTIYARYPLRFADKKKLLAQARENNLELAEWYRTPIHPLGSKEAQSVGYESESCPQAELRSSEIVSLPTHQRVSESYLDRVTEFLNKAA